MVDPAQNQSNGDEKIKKFMEKTPALLKSKFLSVLDSSNDLLNDISNRLEFSLSLSASSDTETVDDETNTRKDDESMDENIVDFESRKVKERRAYEEVISGKYRQPNLIIGKITLNEYNIVDINPKSPSNSSDSNCSNTTTPYFDNQSTPGSTDFSFKLDHSDHVEDVIKEDLDDTNNEADNRTDSSITSQNDQVQSSIESQDLNFYIPSESENSQIL